MTAREKHLLWMILNKAISRYILVNMPGRECRESWFAFVHEQDIMPLYTHGWWFMDHKRARR